MYKIKLVKQLSIYIPCTMVDSRHDHDQMSWLRPSLVPGPEASSSSEHFESGKPAKFYDSTISEDTTHGHGIWHVQWSPFQIKCTMTKTGENYINNSCRKFDRTCYSEYTSTWMYWRMSSDSSCQCFVPIWCRHVLPRYCEEFAHFLLFLTENHEA